MPILKLPNAGDTATLTVTGVEEVAAKNPNWSGQIRFNAGEDCLYVPINSATRQLARLGITDISDAIGRTLTFSRAANSSGAQPYWNIALATDAPAPRRPAATKAVAAAAARPASPASPARWNALEAGYRHALRIAHQEVGQMPNATIADTVAAAATLFIQAAKMGLLTDTAAPAPTPVPASVLSAFDAVPAALAAVPDDDGLPF